MVEIKHGRVFIDRNQGARVLSAIRRIELNHVARQIFFFWRTIFSQGRQRNLSNQIWVLQAKSYFRLKRECFSFATNHTNHDFFQARRELSSTHQQGSGFILKSIDQIPSLGKDDSIVKGQERCCGNYGTAGHICIRHSGILTTLEKSVQRIKNVFPGELRPREKLLSKGPDQMNDAELLSILLRTGSQGENSLALSVRLLDQFGSISAILNANYEDLIQFKGIGVAKWSQLKVIYELVQRSYLEKLKQESVLSSTGLVKNYLISLIGHKEHEVFVCLYLDHHLRLINCHEIFRGSIAETTVHIREIAKECLLRNASYLIIAHNHPSGYLEPSDADLELTKSLYEALKLIDIQLLDHCIVARQGAVSLTDLKIMPK